MNLIEREGFYVKDFFAMLVLFLAAAVILGGLTTYLWGPRMSITIAFVAGLIVQIVFFILSFRR